MSRVKPVCVGFRVQGLGFRCKQRAVKTLRPSAVGFDSIVRWAGWRTKISRAGERTKYSLLSMDTSLIKHGSH